MRRAASALSRVIAQHAPKNLHTLRSAGVPHLAGSLLEFRESERSNFSPWATFGAAGLVTGSVLLSVSHTEPQAQEAAASNPYAPPKELRGIPKEVILFQYEVCPFCCKVKAFLDYHKIPYRTVEVSPLTKSELKWSEYKKVPVVVMDGEPVNDSSAVISRLAAELESAKLAEQKAASKPSRWGAGKRSAEQPASKATAASREEEEKWRRWVDSWFVRVITVNIYRTLTESFQTFDYIASHGNFNFAEREAARYTGALLMWGISGKLRKKYGIEGDVRERLLEAANEWVDAVGDRPFMGGDAPNLADLAVCGVLRSIVGTDTFMDVMHNSRIGKWYERMLGAIGDTSRIAA